MGNNATERVQVLKAHLALNVKDVERSVEFYRQMLGLEPLKVRAGYAKFDVANPPLNLTLNQVPFGERGALSHLGLQVASTDDVLAMRQQWAESGLTTRDEMQTNCCYAIQDKTWVSDPDGNQWEVFVVLEDDLPITEMCCAPAEAQQQPTETRSGCAAEALMDAEAVPCCGTAATETAQSSCCVTQTAPVTHALRT